MKDRECGAHSSASPPNVEDEDEQLSEARHRAEGTLSD